MAIDAIPFGAESFSAMDQAALDRQFERLLAFHGPALTRLAGSYTNRPGDRDDLAQEIAIAIWQALPRFRGECSERTFVFRIAHNRAIAYLARVRSRVPELDNEVEIGDPAPNPESGLVRQEQSERLRAAVHRLPIIYRQVTILSLEGLDYEEIAEVLGISENNVGVRLSRARQILRELLEGRK